MKENNDYIESGHSNKHEKDALNEMESDTGKSLSNQIDFKFVKLAQSSGQVITFRDKSISVKIRGPTGFDLTRAGNIGIWNIARWFGGVDTMVTYARNPATDRTVLDMDRVYANRFAFIASMKCTVTEDLYKLVDASERRPLSVDAGLQNIGNSSLGTVLFLRDESGRELARSVMHVVFVDETSRKPVPIPDWWKKKYASSVKENKKFIPSELGVPTENTYKYTFKVSWNDIDIYTHVNYLSYVMFCFDAAMDAVKNRFYVGFYDDILKYNVKTLQVRYINEALAGDNLTVVTWQDAQDPRIIHFNIERDGKVLVQISMEFFLRANL